MNERMRKALREIEAAAAAALAQQPEDEAKCGQILYDALVTVHNKADLACYFSRHCGDESPRTGQEGK